MEHTFSGVSAFALLCVLMLAGTVLRANFSILQRNLVPSGITGGVLGFVLLAVAGEDSRLAYDYTAFTFHFFTLSFMSLCLTVNDHPAKGGTTAYGGLWLALIWVACLAMQAIIGFGVVYILNITGISTASEYLGALSTHGFTQGPGQVLAFGAIWQDEFAIREAAKVGIIFASLGFVIAFAVGIPAARWAIAKGLNANKSASITPDFQKGLFAPDDGKLEGRQITHPSNIDSLAYHICLLGLAYFITEQWLVAAQDVLAGNPDNPRLIDILFSHNLFFIHGLVWCLIIRYAFVRFGLAHYLDSATQKRITGSAVDFMVVSALLSIKFAILAEFIAPIVSVVVAITVATALLCYFLGKQLKQLGLERALAIFGCCTGSTGSGLLLLRLIDPDFRTQVPQELAFFNVAVLFLPIHILVFVAPTLPAFSVSTFLLIYGGTFVLCIALLLVLQKRMNRISSTRP
ncbi:MAG: hypothetical protein JJ850_01540 [Kordiimonadaceae bacterium]|nr:hypothetical protein [Kordiimonadaceae bacterium]MBO6567516.1 hypothetical protein [Kordiimonadaceae bacterium]MBO6963270.1 hypothetical protein [Kordiimonadaceae bacterium]